MNDYLNGTLANIVFDEFVEKGMAAHRAHSLIHRNKGKLSDRLIVKMADYMIHKGERMKEHHPIPKGA